MALFRKRFRTSFRTEVSQLIRDVGSLTAMPRTRKHVDIWSNAKIERSEMDYIEISMIRADREVATSFEIRICKRTCKSMFATGMWDF